jgi:Protein of unknown function (DUF4007)
MTMFTNRAETGELPRLLFGRHQGYDLREQWLSKGLLALAHAENTPARARLFAFPEASDRFGMGPGMVLAMRYWLRATGLMIEQSSKQHGRKVPMLTPLGALLAQYDPYLERVGSLWLLHAHLARNLLLAPTFSWFFQCFVRSTLFTKDECLEALHTWAIKDAPNPPVHRDVLRRDLECLLRLYAVGREAPTVTPEQAALASPFRRLQVLRCLPPPTGAERAERPIKRVQPHYLFYPPQLEQIPALVTLALVLQANEHVNTISLTHLLYRQQQPGRTCGLKQETLMAAFQWLSLNAPSWSPARRTIAGQPWLELPAISVEQVLLRYYTKP